MSSHGRLVLLAPLFVAPLLLAAPPDDKNKADNPNKPARRPAGVELILSPVGVTRKSGTTDTYRLTVNVQNWGRTRQEAGIILRAVRTVDGTGGKDARIVQEMTLPALGSLASRNMVVEYRITDLAAAPTIFGLTKFELLSPVYRGRDVVDVRPFTDVENRNNTSQITGSDLVAKIRTL